MLVGLLSWWYGDGLTRRTDEIGERFARTADFFSVGLLARTLFTPFRQLSAGKVRGPLEVQVRAAIDNLVSRLIGALVRSAMIVVAFFAGLGVLIYGVAVLAGWILLPVLPLVGVVLAVAGVRL